MESQVGLTPHFGSNSFPLILSLSHRLRKHSYGQAKPTSSVGLRLGVSVPFHADGPAPIRHHLSCSRIAGVVELMSPFRSLSYFLPHPLTSAATITRKWRFRPTQQTAGRGVVYTSKLDSFWTYSGRIGLVDSYVRQRKV